MFQFINPSTALRGLRPTHALSSKLNTTPSPKMHTALIIEEVPTGLSNDQAVTLPCNATSPFITLLHHKSDFGIPAPVKGAVAAVQNTTSHVIVIIGADTKMGRMAIQYARIAKISTIIGVAPKSREKELTIIGLTCVVDHDIARSEILATVRAAAGGEDKVTHVYDCVNWTFELATELLAPGKASVLLALHPIDEAAARDIKARRPNCEPRFVAGITAGLGASKEFACVD